MTPYAHGRKTNIRRREKKYHHTVNLYTCAAGSKRA